MLGVPTPVEADLTGNGSFRFQKHVAKDAELFEFDAGGNAAPASHERGFADVWKRDSFGWEYRGPSLNVPRPKVTYSRLATRQHSAICEV